MNETDVPRWPKNIHNRIWGSERNCCMNREKTEGIRGPVDGAVAVGEALVEGTGEGEGEAGGNSGAIAVGRGAVGTTSSGN
jgi:hypothetical protein